MKKLAILILVVGFIVLVYGCCSHSGNSVFVNPQGDEVITQRTVVIDELGRLPTVTFPSGAKIEASEENTLTPGIIVTVTEQKLSSNNTAYFMDSTGSGYLYRITAVLKPSSTIGQKTYVTTTEKPFRITLPKAKNSSGIVLAGIRESDTDPWRFFNFSDSNDSLINNISGMRTSKASPGEYRFNLFRLGIQFLLITFEGNPVNELPDSFVSSLVASSTTSILVKEGKYLEDLNIKGILSGLKLDSIKPVDLRARITYRNNQADEAPIKLNGMNITQTNKADKTVPGYSFAHSFVVDNVSKYNLVSTSGDFDFILNLKGVEIQSFPLGFLVEFYNKVESEKILPYNYTEFYTVKRIESVNLALASDEGNLSDEGENLYKWNPTFTIASGYEFSDADKAKIVEAITVSDVDKEKISMTWNGRVMTLGFTENLLPDKTYTISMAEVTDLENSVVTPFEDFSFKTIYQYCKYSVVHQQENLSDSGYTVVETENLTAIEKAEVTPAVKVYEGFEAPVAQTITIASDTENKVVYSYNRKVSKLTVNKGSGIAAVSGSGNYKYGADVVASYTLEEGYVFGGWSGDMAVATFTMPDHDVTMTANTGLISYSITYNNIDGCTFTTDNPVVYTTTSDTITLNNPTRNGYTFIGWSGTGLTGSDTTQVTIPQNSTGDREYTANWSLNLSLAIASNTGCIIDEEKELYYTLASFTVTPTVGEGIVLTDSERADILEAVFIKDESNNKLGDVILQKSWDNGRISLSFSKDLEASTTYTISCETIPGVTMSSVPSLPFKTFYYKGRGTEDIPFLVENIHQLDLVRNYLTYCFKQTVNIDIASFANWSPIGDDTNQFTGTYDGNSKKISNLKINTDQQIQYAGIFGYNTGKIRNIVVDGFSVTGGNDSTPLDSEYAGVIIGYNTGEVTDCSLTDSSNSGSIIFGLSCVGGICARSEGSIASCRVDSSNFQLECHADANSYVGGICGYCPNGIISSCCIANSTIQGSKNSSKVLYVGGIIGNQDDGSISSCNVASSTIQGESESTSANVGGIGGKICGSIINCNVVDSTVNGDSIKSRNGGICGYASNCNLTSCQVVDSVVQGYKAGGITSYAYKSSIEYCRLLSSTVRGKINCGGIIGQLQLDGRVTSCYVENSNLECLVVESTPSSGGYVIISNYNVGGICGSITGSTSSTNSANSVILVNSCYVTNSTVKGSICGGISGICIGNSNLISCYICNSTVEGSVCLGEICGYKASNMLNCFTDKANSILGVNSSSGSVTNCYNAVTDFTTFSGKAWSDGLPYNDENSVWKNYNISETTWPPDLKALPRQ